ncbi:hypothetical protein C7G42_21435 [Bradyrhizobium sp. MOS003]|nr:hypothetical protein C7G42_21435 [Bradyrhizobium sp. MOS003]
MSLIRLAFSVTPKKDLRRRAKHGHDGMLDREKFVRSAVPDGRLREIRVRACGIIPDCAARHPG